MSKVVIGSVFRCERLYVRVSMTVYLPIVPGNNVESAAEGGGG